MGWRRRCGEEDECYIEGRRWAYRLRRSGCRCACASRSETGFGTSATTDDGPRHKGARLGNPGRFNRLQVHQLLSLIADEAVQWVLAGYFLVEPLALALGRHFGRTFSVSL